MSFYYHHLHRNQPKIGIPIASEITLLPASASLAKCLQFVIEAKINLTKMIKSKIIQINLVMTNNKSKPSDSLLSHEYLSLDLGYGRNNIQG